MPVDKEKVVDDVQSLFREVRDEFGGGLQFVLQNRPDTVYIEPKQY